MPNGDSASLLNNSTRDGQEKNVTMYTWQEVAKHNTRESAWIYIHDTVYDITPWFVTSSRKMKWNLNWMGRREGMGMGIGIGIGIDFGIVLDCSSIVSLFNSARYGGLMNGYVVCCLFVCCLLFVCLLFVVCLFVCLLFVVCCCCLLFVVCFFFVCLFVVCLFVVCLFVVCLLFLTITNGFDFGYN